jgi:predicted esterase
MTFVAERSSMNAQNPELSTPSAHSIEIRKTARYWSLGSLSPQTRELWFVVHGYGQLAEYFIRHFRSFASDERYIVAPEALSRFYVKEWTRVGASWTTKEERDAEVQDYVAYLQELERRIWQELAERGGARDNVRVWTLGFSQGVTTLCRWIARGGLRPDRLICWAAGFPAEIDLAAHKTLFESMKTTFVVGSNDEFITPEALERQKTAVREAGLELSFVEFDGGHTLEPELLRTIVAGLRLE